MCTVETYQESSLFSSIRSRAHAVDLCSILALVNRFVSSSPFLSRLGPVAPQSSVAKSKVCSYVAHSQNCISHRFSMAHSSSTVGSLWHVLLVLSGRYDALRSNVEGATVHGLYSSRILYGNRCAQHNYPGTYRRCSSISSIKITQLLYY